MKSLTVLLLVWTLWPGWSEAQQDLPAGGEHGSRSLTAYRIEQAPVLDGLLDEAVWQNAVAATQFVQKDPQQGMPATENTEVRALYDDANLYFGVRCFDSQADRIVSRELRRDNRFGNDDSFSIILDTFHDHRNAFLFRINPSGTQYDASITEEGRDVNADWDEKWEVETQVDEEGWSAEIKIPLKSIRFSSSQTSFGIDFERIIRRKNESSYWTNHLRSFNFQQISQAGHLVGVEVEEGLRVRIKPYVNTRMVIQGAEDRNTSFLGDVGLEDLKILLTSGLTVDVTVNTDFAQTESDNQVINFDRFPVFFPEKREFFMEGAGVFAMNPVTKTGTPDVKLYHSRRIGLSADRNPIPIVAGAKLTGRLGEKFTLGLVDAQTDDYQGQPGDNFAAFHLKRDLLSRSSAGVFFTSRQGDQGDYNRMVGLDQNFIFLEHLKVAGVVARSFTDGAEGREWMGGVQAKWDSDLIGASFDHVVIQENFQVDLGFIRRQAVRIYRPWFTFSPRPRGSWIRQFNFGYRLDHVRSVIDDEIVTSLAHFDNSIVFQDGSSVFISPHRRTENLRTYGRLPGGLTVAPGKYTWNYSEFRYRLNPARKVSGMFEYAHEWDYYGAGGRKQEITVSPQIKFNSSFPVGISYLVNRIQLPGQEVLTFHQVNNRFNFSFSRKWLTSTLLQYNSDSEVLGVNFRLNYIYRPGDDLFIVFNEFRDRSQPTTDLDRQIVVKFTHSFDF